MLDNNIQNNTQNENEKVVQNGIQNVHQKFTARQNELRLYIINFTIDNKRPYNLESDKEVTLQVLQMDEQEYEEIIQCLIDKDGMVVDEEAKNVNFIYPVSSLETNHRVTLADGRELQRCVRLTLWELHLHFIRTQKCIQYVQCVKSLSM